MAMVVFRQFIIAILGLKLNAMPQIRIAIITRTVAIASSMLTAR